MRRFFIVMLLSLYIGGAYSQNLQLHYDTRHSLYGNSVSEVNYFTATFEMFKPDKWGSTFMFIDFDFSFNKNNIGLVYGEIARNIKIGDCPLMPHIEYNGGLGLVRNIDVGFSIPSSYLAGLSYPFQMKNFFMETYIAYKLNAFPKNSHDVQWTFVWNGTLANKKLTLSGFIDIWTENKNIGGTVPVGATAEKGKRLVFLSEPQIWYNATPNLSFGSEIELSYNFINRFFGESKFYAIPTIATKWTF